MKFNPFQWLTSNLSALLLAFLLALIVWISAVVGADPNEVREYSRPLILKGDVSDLEIMTNLPTQSKISIRAPKSVLDNLTRNPDLLETWIDLSNLEAGTHSLSVQTSIGAGPALIVGLEPQTVGIYLEKKLTLSFPINLTISGDPSLGYRKGTPISTPVIVRVTGPDSIVNKVKQVSAKIDISGARETVQSNVLVVPLDENGVIVPDVALSPRSVNVTLPIHLEGGYRDVIVKVTTQNSVPNGYRLTHVSVLPPIVTIFSSDPQIVNDLPGFVETQAIDLFGLRDDTEVRLELNLPPEVSLVGEQSVLVQIGIASIEGSTTISLLVEPVGLTPDKEVTIQPSLVDVLVSGPIPVLEQLTKSSFRVIVDLNGLEFGNHQITPVVDLIPEGVVIEGINPKTVEVFISPVPNPSPTPESP